MFFLNEHWRVFGKKDGRPAPIVNYRCEPEVKLFTVHTLIIHIPPPSRSALPHP